MQVRCTGLLRKASFIYRGYRPIRTSVTKKNLDFFSQFWMEPYWSLDSIAYFFPRKISNAAWAFWTGHSCFLKSKRKCFSLEFYRSLKQSLRLLYKNANLNALFLDDVKNFFFTNLNANIFKQLTTFTCKKKNWCKISIFFFKNYDYS